jgi:hypothetical protein
MTSGGPDEETSELPPGLVRRAAQGAFRERVNKQTHRLRCVFDSVEDGPDASDPRSLMFAGGGIEVVLRVSAIARGTVVAGAVHGASVQHVAIRRPMRATIEIPLGDDGQLTPTFVPSGTGSVLVDESAHISWRSDWFTL